ncbi:MAG TPA: DUF222 domain-containing protein [Jiangellaceae bacterium]|nr:DUF222 domain-containing protein [Jiangellaceae bacterium]
MFEATAETPGAEDSRQLACARLTRVLPAARRRVQTGEGPVRRAQQIAPGVFRAPGRHLAPADGGDRPGAEVPGAGVAAATTDSGATAVATAGPTADVARVPGPRSVALLAAKNPSAMSSYDLLEAIAGWEQLASWVQARQADVIAAFARRRPGPYAPDQPGPSVSEFAADEIAARLAVSRRAADLKLSLAIDLAERLPATAAALREGRIDVSKAKAIIEHTGRIDDVESRRRVEDRVLARAGTQTAPELRRSLLRAVHAVDPHAVRRRRAKAQAERGVQLQPLPDAMAEITAVLPAEDAMTVFTALDAIAQCADPADPRPVDARRADALTDLCRNVLAVGYAPAMSGCHDGDDGAHRGGEGSRASADRRSRRRRRRSGPQIQVTVAATTLLGVDDRPGVLAGYGPIPAEVARQIAADPHASWRRILTDPASGVLLDYGTTVYRPPPALARHVRARDQVCAFPGCRQPAARCDLDHCTPYPHGPTCAANLGPLCRHHHRAKTDGGWRWQRHDDGTIVWTAPTGHQYQTQTPPALGDAWVGDPRAYGPPPHDPPPF